jgi:hypothetical protein
MSHVKVVCEHEEGSEGYEIWLLHHQWEEVEEDPATGEEQEQGPGARAEWDNDDEARKLWDIHLRCMAEALEKAKAAVRVAEENQRVAMTGYCDKMGTCKCGQEMVVFSRVDTGREPEIYYECTGYDFCSDGATEAQWSAYE